MAVSDTLTLTASEWAGLGEKAARGAGYSWGLAEEAGFVLAGLAGMGINGSIAALSVLARKSAGELGAPVPAHGAWRAGGAAPLCPILTGAALRDLGLSEMGAFGAPRLELPEVAAPILLLPTIDALARSAGLVLVMQAADVTWRCGAASPGDPDAAMRRLGTSAPVRLARQLGEDAAPAGLARPSAPITRVAYDALQAFALHTTVPPSSHSRETGAGAGLTDND